MAQTAILCSGASKRFSQLPVLLRQMQAELTKTVSCSDQRQPAAPWARNMAGRSAATREGGHVRRTPGGITPARGLLQLFAPFLPNVSSVTPFFVEFSFFA